MAFDSIALFGVLSYIIETIFVWIAVPSPINCMLGTRGARYCKYFCSIFAVLFQYFHYFFSTCSTFAVFAVLLQYFAVFSFFFICSTCPPWFGSTMKRLNSKGRLKIRPKKEKVELNFRPKMEKDWMIESQKIWPNGVGREDLCSARLFRFAWPQPIRLFPHDSFYELRLLPQIKSPSGILPYNSASWPVIPYGIRFFSIDLIKHLYASFWFTFQ